MSNKRQENIRSMLQWGGAKTQRRAGDLDDSGIRQRKIRPQINLNTILLVILIVVCGVFFSLSDTVSFHKHNDCAPVANSSV